MEPDRLQHERPAATCVIAQQYSFVTYVWLRFHSHKENVCAFHNVIISVFLFKKFINWENVVVYGCALTSYVKILCPVIVYIF
jgi:hypothetical protein